MRILTFGHFIFVASATGLLSLNINAQTQKMTISQNPEFERMLNEKRRVNTSITVNDRYKIQIFNGESEASKKVLSDFKREFSYLDGTIVFSTPAYKVWVGNFKSRIEAERNLAVLKDRYPNALLIKPNK